MSEAVTRSCSVKKKFLKFSQNSQENSCARASFLMKLQTSDNFIQKGALAHLLSYEFCEIFMNTFFIDHIRWLLFEYVFICIIFCQVLIIFSLFSIVSVADIDHVSVYLKRCKITTDIFPILESAYPENTGERLKVNNRNSKTRREIC